MTYQRLIKNKTLLNAVEPVLENHCLEVLLGILQRRIELDKEVLFQFTQLRKDSKLLDGVPLSQSVSSASNASGSSNIGVGANHPAGKTKHHQHSHQSVAPPPARVREPLYGRAASPPLRVAPGGVINFI